MHYAYSRVYYIYWLHNAKVSPTFRVWPQRGQDRRDTPVPDMFRKVTPLLRPKSSKRSVVLAQGFFKLYYVWKGSSAMSCYCDFNTKCKGTENNCSHSLFSVRVLIYTSGSSLQLRRVSWWWCQKPVGLICSLLPVWGFMVTFLFVSQ